MAFIVNTAQDGDDAVLGDGTAGYMSGGKLLTSLRSAIQEGNDLANAGTTSVTITFDMPAIASDRISFTNRLTELGANFTIEGPGASLLAVERDPSTQTRFRVFKVSEGKAVSINNLGIRNGSDSGSGGGIFNAGSLTLDGCAVYNNKSDFMGGGIYSQGNLTIRNSFVYLNDAGLGGGIVIDGGQSSQISASHVISNSAVSSGGGIAIYATGARFSTTEIYGNTADIGGGIYSNKPIEMSGGVIHGNTATAEGGGLYLFTAANEITGLSGIELTDNHTGGKGGGVYIRGGDFRLTQPVSFSGNTADNGGKNDGGAYNKNDAKVTIFNPPANSQAISADE